MISAHQLYKARLLPVMVPGEGATRVDTAVGGSGAGGHSFISMPQQTSCPLKQGRSTPFVRLTWQARVHQKGPRSGSGGDNVVRPPRGLPMVSQLNQRIPNLTRARLCNL